MKELEKKTFLTISAILTVVVLFSLILVNVQNYNRECELIRKNLNVYDEKGNFKVQSDRKKDRNGHGKIGPEQIRIVDHEVYTAELSDGSLTNIISHGNASDDFDIQGIVESILKTEKAGSEKIGNLFFSSYSYNYGQNGRIVIVNNSEANTDCRRLLLISILIFAAVKAFIVFISGRMTGWITKPARDSFRKQKEFIADASHELKTPLAVIMASAEELSKRDKPEKGSDEKLLDNILYESDRMNKLIAQLLSLSKLEEGTQLSYAEEDLSKLAEKTALAYEAVAFEQGIEIDTDISKHVNFICNKEEMEKMLSILLDNAIRHSYKDTAVRVELKEIREHINIRIVNKGDPIPEGDEEKIFERFYRGDTSRNRTDNRYGLGLAIARSIAEKHHGDIRARSEDGSTVFEIDLKKK